MKQFTLKLDMPFAEKDLGNGIIFTQFLPRKKDAIECEREGFNVKIYFSYEKKHLNHVSNDFIKKQKDIRKHINISTSSLRFEFHKEITEDLWDMCQVPRDYVDIRSRRLLESRRFLHDLILALRRP